jgi:hypothetical protein
MERAIPVLPADDLFAAKAFYTSLGFGVLWEASEDGRNGIMGLARRGNSAHHRLLTMACQQHIANNSNGG